MGKERKCGLCGKTYSKKDAKKYCIRSTITKEWSCKGGCYPPSPSGLRINPDISRQARGERILGNSPAIQKSLKALVEAADPPAKKEGMTLEQRKEMKKVNPYHFANKLEIFDAPPAAEGENIQYDYVKIRITDPTNKTQMEILVRLDDLIKNLEVYREDLRRRRSESRIN